MSIPVKFYNRYRDLRIKLFEELKENNPDYNEILLLEKAQKYLDRSIFFSFCKDLGALNNSAFKLFRPDEALNKLNINDGDRYFNKIDTLINYDFKNDLDVDVLGHIFEQSISDLEKLKADIQNKDYDKQQSKRKKDGIYYTPVYITKYIVKNSLGKYLDEIKKDLGLEKLLLKLESTDCLQTKENYRKQLIDFYKDYEEKLKQVKILDPACGSGAFLIQTFDFLLEEYRWIHEQVSRLQKDHSSVFNTCAYQDIILCNNLYGVDVNKESVEITKLTFWLKIANNREKLPTREKLLTLDANIKCGDALVDDQEIAGDKAFEWNKQFSNIGEKGFDVVIGNPPWGANIDNISSWLKKRYPKSTRGHKDTYKIFIDLSISLLKDSGYLGFVIPNSFLYQSKYEDIKEMVLKYEHYIVNLGEDIFSNVELPCCIMTLKKTANNTIIPLIIDYSIKPREELPDLILNIDYSQKYDVKKKMDVIKNTGVTFDDVLLIKDAGVQYASPGAGKAGKGKSDLPQRLFSEYKDDIYDTPFYIGKNIKPEGWYLDNNITKWFRSSYKNILQGKEWVRFNETIFKAPEKIIWRQTSDKIRAAYMDFEGFFGKSLHGAIKKEESSVNCNVDFSLLYALALLNSKYINFIYQQKVLEKERTFPQVKIKYLRTLPFVCPNEKQNKLISEKSQKMIDLYKNFYGNTLNQNQRENIKKEIENTNNELNQMVYDLYGLNKEEIEIVEKEMS
ncbi:Eco57I restriction-modification methylase domain-containing protein [Natranaerofaba carboxydovora]|uniref:Eco57I restriction-modification methylase domain-containing protein n=1 Tax=Natranaerofaba carboxydovora TaxID=2742683 RepID=UPI001F143F0C|nr:N-6 DNA methylase [Natranaerofaba carboxydovora]UMZ72568.1 Type IIS restriction enzyme Eco57I [Natranaerofaba carboxydovora]